MNSSYEEGWEVMVIASYEKVRIGNGKVGYERCQI